MTPFATTADLELLWRPLKSGERERAEALLSSVSDHLRVEAKKVGKNLDDLAENDEPYRNALKSVVIDITGRALQSSTDSEPMSQVTQSALGYSFSGTYLVPGGGIFIKKSELARLGIRRQRYGVIDLC